MRLEHFLISRAFSHFHSIKSLIHEKINVQSFIEDLIPRQERQERMEDVASDWK